MAHVLPRTTQNTNRSDDEELESSEPKAVALLSPGVAVDVVAVLFPEARPVFGYEFYTPDPLGALPRVQARDDEPQRVAVPRLQGLAVVMRREEGILLVEFLDRGVRRVAAVARHGEEFGFRLRLRHFQQVPSLDTHPDVVQLAPRGNAVHIRLDLEFGQFVPLLPGEPHGILGKTGDGEIPSVRIESRGRAVGQDRPPMAYEILSRRHPLLTPRGVYLDALHKTTSVLRS